MRAGSVAGDFSAVEAGLPDRMPLKAADVPRLVHASLEAGLAACVAMQSKAGAAAADSEPDEDRCGPPQRGPP